MSRSTKGDKRVKTQTRHSDDTEENIDDFIALAELKHAKQKDNTIYLKQMLEPVQSYYNQSASLIQRCTKPDMKEYKKIVTATSIGFLVMGFIGYFVKLVHIPINNLIVN